MDVVTWVCTSACVLVRVRVHHQKCRGDKAAATSGTTGSYSAMASEGQANSKSGGYKAVGIAATRNPAAAV